MEGRLFVYGTLMPGHLRWGLVAPFALRERPAEVAGQLFDTGRGWPAARFTMPLDAPPLGDGQPAPGVTVPGWVVDVLPEAIDGLLVELDEVEGVATGDYRRIQVGSVDGVRSWAYEASQIDPAWSMIPVWLGADER